MSDNDGKLPELTKLQFRYVLARKKGKNKSDSYRAATDTSNMQPQSVWANAQQLENHAKVSLWLTQINIEKISLAGYTLEQDMNRIKELALEAKNYSAATKACENLGKAADHYTTHIESTVTRKADNDLLDEIEKSLGPQARTEAERRLGLH